MGKTFEFIVLIALIVLLLGGFFFYIYVVVLGNPISIPNGKVLGDKDINYNVPEPEVIREIKDFVLSENIKNKINDSNNPNGNFGLTVSATDIDTEVTSVNSAQRLDETGWLVLPYSYNHQHGLFARIFDRSRRNRNEAIVICHRNFYSSRDKRSCYYNDRIEVDHLVVFNEQNYRVISTSTIPTGNDYIFEPSADENLLKIITNSGPNKEANMNTHYLIVIAQKI